MQEPHIEQHQPNCNFSGLFILRIFFFPEVFIEDFVINCIKNNPSGKDVVWLSEKASHCLLKLCYWRLWDLPSECLMCEKPPVWWARLRNVAEDTIVSVGNIQYFVLLQNSKYCQKLSDLNLEVTANWTNGCEIASAVFICSVPCSVLVFKGHHVQTFFWPLDYFTLAEPYFNTLTKFLEPSYFFFVLCTKGSV